MCSTVRVMPNRPNREDMESVLVKPAEAMERLKVSRQTLARYAEAGHLTAVVLPSGHRRYREDEVDRLANGLEARVS